MKTGLNRNHYVVVTGTPVKKVRKYQSRNRRRLVNRVARLRQEHGGELVHEVTESGTLRLWSPRQVEDTLTVKREAERLAKKVSGHVVLVPEGTETNPV